MNFVCIVCGDTFDAWPCKHRKYCSQRCSRGKQGPVMRPFQWLLNKIRYEAKKAGRPCSLTYNQFLSFTKIENCFYCKARVNWYPHALRNLRSYNLDRQNTLLGYSRGNCVVCCARCNRAKSDHFTCAEWTLIGKVIQQFKRQPR